MVRAERAWIVVGARWAPAGEGWEFWAKNEGKTPAKVASIWCNRYYVSRDDKFKAPADEHTKESTLQSPPCLIPPGAEQIIFRCSREEFEKMSGGGKGEASNFSAGFGSGYVYGRIRYFNVLDTDPNLCHETRWLYWVIPVKDAIPFQDPMHSQHNTYT